MSDNFRGQPKNARPGLDKDFNPKSTVDHQNSDASKAPNRT